MASTQSGVIIGVAAAAIVTAGVAAGGLYGAASTPNGRAQALQLTPVANAGFPPGAVPPETSLIDRVFGRRSLSFADIFEHVSPAVVTIDVTARLDARAMRELQGDAPFNAIPKSPKGGGDEGQGPEAQSSGSGFFISSDGYIVTNNHVIENAEDIKVTLKDGRSMGAKIVGRDEATDLAVLKVSGTGYPFVRFENSGRPRVGDWVIAVGDPFGLGGTATAGIVSAYGRDIGDSFVDFIQIDAPINRGNSGGPTFDIYGRVIGVNSAIFSPSGGSVGIGFAIPADIADDITKELITKGKITRGYMGAVIQNVTPELADSMNMSGKKGALVAELAPGGPAQAAGLKPGDVIVELNGHAVGGSTELTRMVAQSHAGDALHLSVMRAGKTIALDVRSGVRPSESSLANNDSDDDDDNGSNAPTAPKTPQPEALGMTLGALTDSLRAKLDVPPSVRGAVVLAVKPSSDAGTKGVRAGDVIAMVGDQVIDAPGDVGAAAAQARAKGSASIRVGVRRGGHMLFVPLKIDN
jgi:serine protease Do